MILIAVLKCVQLPVGLNTENWYE